MADAIAAALATAQAITANAERLGLVWNLRPATVTLSDVANNRIEAVLDGDSVPIAMISMCGMPLVDDRVYVIQVPPAGKYIVGMVADGGSVRGPWTAVFTGTGSRSIVATIPTTLDIYSLVFDWTLRDGLAGFRAATLSMTVNGDTTNNYAFRFIQAAGASASALTHTQTFATGAATAGIYPTGGATAGRFGNGTVRFPAWNSPHPGQLGYEFVSDFENGANDGWYLTGGGFYGVAATYTTVEFVAQVGATWAAGSQVFVQGFRR